MSQHELKALLSSQSVEARTRTCLGKAGLNMDEEVMRLNTELAATRRTFEEKDEELHRLRSALEQAKSDVEEAQAEARTQSLTVEELDRQLERCHGDTSTSSCLTVPSTDIMLHR